MDTSARAKIVSAGAIRPRWLMSLARLSNAAAAFYNEIWGEL